jgi:hypothetical protein
MFMDATEPAMPTESGKPLIVISYAHADEPERPGEGEVKWLSFVTGYLRPAIKHLLVDLWTDWRMPGGIEWEREIKQKLGACDIFLVLVSHHSLSSDYIVDKELPIIRTRLGQGDTVRPYPLVLTPTPDAALAIVKDWNLRPRDGKPLSDYPLAERFRHMNAAANEIAGIVGEMAIRNAPANPDPSMVAGASSPTASTAASRIMASTRAPSALAEASQQQQPPIPDEASPLAKLQSTEIGDPSAQTDFHDRRSFEKWLEGQEPNVPVLLATRAALRVLPASIQIGDVRRGWEETIASRLRGQAFRAIALARVSAMWPSNGPALQIALDSAVTPATSHPLSPAGVAADAADAARLRVTRSAARASAARAAENAALILASEAGPAASQAIWEEIRFDARLVQSLGAAGLSNCSTWAAGRDQMWASDAWTGLKATLPKEEYWEVWIDWYQERLRGGSRGEAYELVFASVPQEEWDKGPAAANAWILDHIRRLGLEHTTPRHDIDDKNSLQVWLRGQSHKVAVAMAARNSLRLAPLAIREQQNRLAAGDTVDLGALASSIFLTTAMAWVAAKYPTRTPQLGPGAESAAATARVHHRYLGSAALVTSEAGAVAATAVSLSARNIIAEDNGDSAAAASFSHALTGNISASVANTAAALGSTSIWEEVRFDISTFQEIAHSTTLDTPLWRGSAPDWANAGWAELRAALPKDEDWEVWIDWYENRLRGASRSEEYELVFAIVPLEVWGKGPSAANAWIKAHLPKAAEPARPIELPTPLAGLDAPFAYGWTASQRIAVVAGAQNLPDYRHFSSEEDHRRVLDACRIGGERLVKSLRSGRYNARPEYGEAVEYYLDDLPKTAGAGNILLANSQARILHDMFLADADTLSPGLASALKSFIGNHFSLCAFYDLVQRHNEAVSAGNWSQPFPLEAAKSFFDAVDENTPRWFEHEVEQGLHQVERAKPPPPAASESTPASAIEPPPLPPGTPDAQDSWKRQMATSANALWETFLQGRDMPVAQDEWRAAADELGPHVRPIIDFLRAQDEGKA